MADKTEKRTVLVEVEEIEMQGDFKMVDGIRVECTECETSIECFGRSKRSTDRACILLRERCPNDEKNIYMTKVDLSIVKHPALPLTHSMVIVEWKGRIYGCVWAGVPTEKEAQLAWVNDGNAFRPYDQSTGEFIK